MHRVEGRHGGGGVEVVACMTSAPHSQAWWHWATLLFRQQICTPTSSIKSQLLTIHGVIQDTLTVNQQLVDEQGTPDWPSCHLRSSNEASSPRERVLAPANATLWTANAEFGQVWTRCSYLLCSCATVTWPGLVLYGAITLLRQPPYGPWRLLTHGQSLQRLKQWFLQDCHKLMLFQLKGDIIRSDRKHDGDMKSLTNIASYSVQTTKSVQDGQKLPRCPASHLCRSSCCCHAG
jgi:hypothetical protein